MKPAGYLNENDRQCIKKFMEDKIKNSNSIIDYLKELQSDDIQVVKKTMTILSEIFSALILYKDIKIPKNIQANLLTAKDKLDNWFYERYNEVYSQFLELLQHSDNQIQLISLTACLKLLQKEACHPVTSEILSKFHFPITKLTALVSLLLSTSKNNVNIIKKFRKNLEYPDFLYVTLHVISNILKENTELAKEGPIFINNLFAMIEVITLPIPGVNVLLMPTLFINTNKNCAEESQGTFNLPYEKAQKDFDYVWDIFLHCHLPDHIYIKCLVLIPDKVLVHMEKPDKLTDFFLNAYNFGGVFSVMALHGVYILVNQYNISYPEFYDKLYTLLNPTIFEAKYRLRFFNLCNKCFSSPCVPEYVTAAFVKRMCRLMLVAPSSSLILMLRFVSNLLVQSPYLSDLIDNQTATGLDDDPFLADAPTPELSQAKKSSLWEIKTIRQNPLPGLPKATHFVDIRRLPDILQDFSRNIDMNSDQFYEKITKMRDTEIATTFHEPQSLFDYHGDRMSSQWCLE